MWSLMAVAAIIVFTKVVGLYGAVGHVPVLAQVVGLYGAGAAIIVGIGRDAWMARQISKTCKLLGPRVDMLFQLLLRARPLQQQHDEEAARALAGLYAALAEAHELVMFCRGCRWALMFFMADVVAARFRTVDKKIDSYLALLPAIRDMAITIRRDHTSSSDDPHQQPLLLDLDPCATTTKFTLDFLKSITGNFSDNHELGRGGFGVVYKGVLENGETIAVKKLRDDIHPDSDDQFHKEVTSLIGLEHKNIVRLNGYCDESTKEGIQQMSDGSYVKAVKRHRLICFEYLSNKSLDNHLSDESSGLEWHVRYEIIKGICCGLDYLHKECIVHLDLKPQNVLMDDNMAPKIADFGLSRLFGEQKTHTITTKCRGTFGYMAQEYVNNGLISTKSDIFSFGVIIIELLIGSRDYPQSYEAPFEHFIENVVRRWRNKLEKTWKDEHLEIYCRQVKACIEIGMKCVDLDPKKRPAAWDVIQILI